jgi:formamidopyrimidine-DNA glycosylase
VPELPEVETVARALSGPLAGSRIEAVEVLRPDLLTEPEEKFRRGLTSRRIGEVGRRGKNLVFSLSGPQLLVINLGMTGRLLFAGKNAEPPRSTHPGLRLHLHPGGTLIYDDIRRFGRIRRLSPRAWALESERLGPEPLDPALSAVAFQERLSRSRTPVRSWLLDQSRLAGVGNIYANEALFRAGIHPARPARSLSPGEAGNLLKALRETLAEAIRARGTTLRDFRTAEGDPGGYGPFLRIYGQEGSVCPVCGSLVERMVLSKRSAFFCPRCQPKVS